MAVLPLHVHDDLGFSTFTVGLVAGSQFMAAVFSRPSAGFYADRNGAKRAIIFGLIVAVVSGALYLGSLQFVATPLTSISILIVGRIALGVAESFIITGALSWGLTRAGIENTGERAFEKAYKPEKLKPDNCCQMFQLFCLMRI